MRKANFHFHFHCHCQGQSLQTKLWGIILIKSSQFEIWYMITWRSIDPHGAISLIGGFCNGNFVYFSNSTDLEQHNPREGRSKRGVYNLYSMIKCATGCDPLIYKGYGCYCGFLGSGHALDGIDRCCKMHDYCYTTSSCPMFLEYFVPYLWKCYRGKALCGEYSSILIITQQNLMNRYIKKQL